MKEIPLTQGKVALVDDADFDAVSQFKWSAVLFPLYPGGESYIAFRNVMLPNGRWSAQSMHVFLMEPPQGLVTDHHNHNTLDNQRSNLRIATRAQNQQNRGAFRNNKCGFKGVYFEKHVGRFRANISANGKRHSLGYHQTAEQAAAAYNEAAVRLHGEFAVLNEIL